MSFEEFQHHTFEKNIELHYVSVLCTYSIVLCVELYRKFCTVGEKSVQKYKWKVVYRTPHFLCVDYACSKKLAS